MLEYSINPENKLMGDLISSIQQDLPNVKIVDTYPTSILIHVKGLNVMPFINYMNGHNIVYTFRRIVADDTGEISNDR